MIVVTFESKILKLSIFGKKIEYFLKIFIFLIEHFSSQALEN